MHHHLPSPTLIDYLLRYSEFSHIRFQKKQFFIFSIFTKRVIAGKD